jgi:uncharacterized repeat protein (TIGR03803 family)
MDEASGEARNDTLGGKHMNRTAQFENQISAVCRLKVRCALVLGLMFVSLSLVTLPAQAQTYSVLYTFQGGTDGASPRASLIRDAKGNLYGTTYYGDTFNDGVAFKLNTTRKERLLHTFDGADGAQPWAALVRDSAGNLYGTTYNGGVSGYGLVFKLDTKGNETRLYSFTGGADGGNPRASLVRDSAGNLYGTSIFGGASGKGTVFKVDMTGKETVLYSFKDGVDGGYPWAGLVRDAAGNLYGTAVSGGTSNLGVVFKLSKTGKETVLHSFAGGTDGVFPASGNLLRDSAGNLYGTTPEGGAPNFGVVYKLDKTGAETVLYTFTGQSDGGHSIAGLVRDPAGNLYGTTDFSPNFGYGGVFKLSPSGQLTVLYNFTGKADGEPTYATLLRDTAGNLYGTTYTSNPGQGVVFELTP